MIKRFGKDFLDSFSPINYNGRIGSYGDIVFVVTPFNMLTPNSGTITYSNKTVEHENLGEVPTSEFLHRNLRQGTLSIKLMHTKCNVLESIKKLEQICENGEYYPLILGGIPLSASGFSLTSFSVNIKSVGRNGNVEIAECNLNFKEYIPQLQRTLNIVANDENNETTQLNAIDNDNLVPDDKESKIHNKILNEDISDEELLRLSNEK